MDDRREGRLLRLLLGVEDYWPEGLSVLATAAIAILAVWLGDLPDGGLLRVVYLAGFALAVVVYLVSAVIIAKRTPGTHSLVRRNEELEHALEQAEEGARADYFDLVRHQLIVISEELGLGDT